MATLIVRFISAPYKGSSAADGLDFALAATNYGHEVSVLFDDMAVWMWHADQAAPKGVKSIAKRLKSLPLFDIDLCYISKHALSTHHVAPFTDAITELDEQGILALLNRADHVVTF